MEKFLQFFAPFSILIFMAFLITSAVLVANMLNSENTGDSKSPSYKRLGYLVALLSILMLVVVWAFTSKFADFSRYSLSDSVQDWGAVGDFFGGMLNPIFAFASLIAILTTIKIQTDQMKKSEHQIKKSDDSIAEHQKSMQKQQFESFFLEIWKTMPDQQTDFDKNFTIAKESYIPRKDATFNVFSENWDMESTDDMIKRVGKTLIDKGTLYHPYFLKFIACIEMINSKTSVKEGDWKLDKNHVEFYLNILMSSVSQNFLQVIAFLFGYNRNITNLNHYSKYVTHFGLLQYLDVTKPIFSGHVKFYDVYKYHWEAYGSNAEAFNIMRANGCTEYWKDKAPKNNQKP